MVGDEVSGVGQLLGERTFQGSKRELAVRCDTSRHDSTKTILARRQRREGDNLRYLMRLVEGPNRWLTSMILSTGRAELSPVGSLQEAARRLGSLQEAVI